jgi:hypothetical protein
MISLADTIEYIKSIFEPCYIENINWMITLTVITLSGFHCTSNYSSVSQSVSRESFVCPQNSPVCCDKKQFLIKVGNLLPM